MAISSASFSISSSSHSSSFSWCAASIACASVTRRRTPPPHRRFPKTYIGCAKFAPSCAASAFSRRALAVLVALAAVAVPAYANVVAIPVLTGLKAPVEVGNAADGSGRLFVVEQGGRIRVVRGNALLGIPFLDLSTSIVSGGEQGLLGLAFHPQFRSNGRFFVNYTRAADGAAGVASY